MATNKWAALAGSIERASNALLPLLSDAPGDAPDKILSEYPNPGRIIAAHKILIDSMFVGRFSDGVDGSAPLDLRLLTRVREATVLLADEVERALPFRWIGQAARADGATDVVDVKAETERVLSSFLAALPIVRGKLIEDVRAAYDGDPSALTYAEVQLAFPGILAITSHRLAHELYRLNVPIVPRVMSEWTHTQTGIDINPGAQIGQGFFIDHGTGVVIGETAVIGDRVKLYQGVTLGAKSFSLDEAGNPIKHVKRHPTVEQDVIIYANAIILGGDTVIGANSTIGGGVFLMESVPAGSTVISKRPELHIKQLG